MVGLCGANGMLAQCVEMNAEFAEKSARKGTRRKAEIRGGCLLLAERPFERHN